MLFAAFTLMRPSELYVLRWTDIDFEAMRIRKSKRLYRGDVDDPKYGRATIALTPPARDAALTLPRDGGYVFCSITGRRLSQPTLSGYWGKVKARSGLDFDFYHATKHYGVHYLWTKLRLPRLAIAAQAGWSIGTIDKMLAINGHGEVGALEEVDAAFAALVNPVVLDT
jgi:integrase